MKMLDYIYANLYAIYKKWPQTYKGDSPENYSVYILVIGLVLWSAFITALGYRLMVGKIPLIVGKIHAIVLISWLALAAVFYYLLYNRYVKNKAYLDLYNRHQFMSNKQLVIAKIWCFIYLVLPVVLMVVARTIDIKISL